MTMWGIPEYFVPDVLVHFAFISVKQHIMGKLSSFIYVLSPKQVPCLLWACTDGGV